MKKITIIIVLIGVLIVSGYVFIRSKLNTHDFHPVGAARTPQPKPSESTLDLRPKIIARLQQLVKQGSGGLYNLYIREVEPDVVLSKLDVRHVILMPDSNVIRSLVKMNIAPENIFKISFDSLHIDGIGINDFLNKNSIDIKKIYLTEPSINVYFQKRQSHVKHDKNVTLYQRLSKVLKHLGIDSVIILNGTVQDHQLTKKTNSSFDHVNVRLSKILVDSSTQYDADRFLFAKKADISSKNINIELSNHLYNMKIGSVEVSAIGKMIKASNIALIPKYGKQEFERKTTGSKERYEFLFRSAMFKNMDWWDMANGEKFIADEMEVNNGDLNIYLDVSYPPGPIHKHNYPHQLLRKMKLPIDVQRLVLNNINVTYEEYHPKIKETGRLSFNFLHGNVTNLTNVPARIKNNPYAIVDASARLIGKVPVKANIKFNLADKENGSFTADISVGNADATLFNYLTEPFGLFMIKRGTLQSVNTHVEGDNYKGNSKVSLLYNSLHITPLKKDDDRESGYKKKHVTSFIANIIFIKNDNPSGDKEPRQGTGNYTRKPGSSFFNLIWKSTLSGMLDIMGLPQKFAK